METLQELDFISAVEDGGLKPSDILNAPIAVAVDIATSAVNSFLPESAEISTSSALSAISTDVASFYENHRQGVEIASLIGGGIVLPGAGLKVGAKLVNLASRNATVGKVNLAAKYFDTKINKYGKEALAAAKDLSTASAQYRTASKKLAAMNVGKGFQEGLLYEASFAATMNGHALMKDDGYDTSDFILGASIGSVFAAGSLLRGLSKMKSQVVAIEAEKAAEAVPFTAVNPKPELVPAGTSLGMNLLQYAKQQQAMETLTGESKRLVESYSLTSRTSVINFAGKLLPERFREFPHNPEGVFETTRAFKDRAPIEHIIQDAKASPELFMDIDALNPYSVILSDAPSGFIAEKNIFKIHSADRVGVSDVQLPDIPFMSEVEDGIFEIDLEQVADFSLIPIAIKQTAAALADTAMKFKVIGKEGNAISKGLKQLFDTEYAAKLVARNDLVTYDEVALFIPRSTELGVYYTTWAGYGRTGMIDSIQANLLKGAADITDFAPRANWNLHAGEVSGKNLADIDGDFLSANLTARKLSPGEMITKVDLDPTNLPQLQAVYLRAVEVSDEFLGVKLADGRILATPNEVFQVLKTSKVNKIQSMRQLSPEQISKATNTPLESVHDILAGVDNSNIMVYDDLTDLERHYKTPSLFRVVAAKGMSPLDEARRAAKLDRDMQLTWEQDYKRVLASGSASSFIQELHNILDTPEHLGILNSMEPVALTRQAAGSTFFSSADQALRATGDVGAIAVAMQDKLSSVVRKKVQHTTETLLPLTQQIAKDQATLVQFNKMLQAFHAMPSEVGVKYVGGKFLDVNDTQLYNMFGEALSFPVGGAIDNFLNTWKPIQEDLTDAYNVVRGNLGTGKLDKSRWWFPYDAMESQYRSYLIEKGDIRVLSASSKEHMESILAELAKDPDAPYKVIPFGPASSKWNTIHGYAKLDPFIRQANLGMRKGGTTFADVPPDARMLDTMLESMSQHYNNIANQLTQHGVLSEVFNTLDQFTEFYKTAEASAAQPGKLQQAGKLSTPEVLKNTLLGYRSSNPIYSSVNNVFAAGINIAYRSALEFFHATPGEQEWKAVQQELKGQQIPWKNVMEYARATIPQNKDIAAHVVSRANALQVMFNLAFADLAHPLVNLLSVPVLATAELTTKNSFYASTKFLMEGVKLAFSTSDEALRVMGRAEAMGAIDPIISEVSTTMAKLAVEPDFVTKLENTKIAEWLQKPTAWSEKVSRKIAYATGYLAAKSRAPGTSEELLEATANLFAKRVSGNYSSAQKPTLFQGAFGSTVGLYQTFAWTVGQNILRYVEGEKIGALKALGGMQAATFGLEGLPGFEQINNLIGDFVEGDIEQAAYSLFGNRESNSRSMAEFVLFGYPSAMLQSSIYTRGAMDVRTPLGINRDGVYFLPAVVSNAVGVYDAMANMFTNMSTNLEYGGNVGRGALEALATQNVWRPLARMSEVVLGHSLNQAGEIISGPDLVYEPWSIIARTLATRPLQENILKDMNYRNQYYNAKDYGRRQEIVRTLRSAVAAQDEGIDIEKIQADYLKNGGSMNGWKQALNKVYLSSSMEYADRLERQANKNPGIVEILNGY